MGIVKWETSHHLEPPCYSMSNELHIRLAMSGDKHSLLFLHSHLLQNGVGSKKKRMVIGLLSGAHCQRHQRDVMNL
jgi:hypothetical protein